METQTQLTVTDVEVRPCGTFEEAMTQANTEAVNTAGFVIPCVLYRQGRRQSACGALPYWYVEQRLSAKPVPKKKATVGEVVEYLNRPENPEHADAIARYITENSDLYVLPPLTLSARKGVRLFTTKTDAPLKAGYLVIPATAELWITDGQHRRSGIAKALLELRGEERGQRLANDSIGVNIIFETEISQIHQDFADASKTKPLPPSQLAVYDRRNPANRIMVDLEQNCALFKGRIDAASKTLSKKSIAVFLASHLRQLVKVVLVGSWQMGDDQFEKQANDLLADADAYKVFADKLIDFVNEMTEAIPVWHQIAELPEGIAQTQIPDLREEGHICLRAIGLVMMGRIAHELFKHDVADWKVYAKRMGAVDWRKTAELWEGNVVSDKGKISTGQALVREGTQRLRAAIGWNPPKPETQQEPMEAELEPALA
jgi:DGQHR domain-containing protein